MGGMTRYWTLSQNSLSAKLGTLSSVAEPKDHHAKANMSVVKGKAHRSGCRRHAMLASQTDIPPLKSIRPIMKWCRGIMGIGEVGMRNAEWGLRND